MKLLAFLLALAAPVATYAQSTTGYQITGRVGGLAEGTKLYLTKGFTRIDSATVHQGQFTLRGRVAEPIFAYVYTGRGQASRKLTDLILENQAITITGSQPEYNYITVGGSAATQHFRDWWAEDERLAHYRAEIRKVYKALPAQDSAASRLQRLTQLIQQDRIAVLKAYVQRYHDSAAGAALPTLCTLDKSLTATDYQQMYQTLTPTWQQTALGREILVQIQHHQAASDKAN